MVPVHQVPEGQALGRPGHLGAHQSRFVTAVSWNGGLDEGVVSACVGEGDQFTTVTST